MSLYQIEGYHRGLINTTTAHLASERGKVVDVIGEQKIFENLNFKFFSSKNLNPDKSHLSVL